MLINVGYGNIVNMDKVVSIVRTEAAPIKRMIQVAKDSNMAIDATCGRKTKCILIMDSGHIDSVCTSAGYNRKPCERKSEQRGAEPMSKKGILAIISGFSGAGKGTVVNRLLEKESYAVSISATTRKPRTGEVDGQNYFFRTKDEFEKMIANEQLIEYAEYVGNYYGTPKDYVFKKLDEGFDVILEIEMQGALKVKEKFPETALIFITPPSADELKKRLVGRGTETAEQIEKRMSRAVDECPYMNQYDYIVVNDDLDECVDEIHRLLQSIHNAKENQQELINMITEDLKKYK